MFPKLKLVALVALLGMGSGNVSASINIAQEPMFAVANVPPMVMLNMSNDNQLYFNAYPDYADLSGDGAAERTYNHQFDYFGYFDSHKCYTYSSSKFSPVGNSDSNNYCSGSQWSGNFLNWVAMARIDTVRKILYGGYRSTDGVDSTVLERTYLPNDAHSWVRHYTGSDIDKLTPFSLPAAAVTSSTSMVTVPEPPAGERNNNSYRRTFSVPAWTANDAQLGDQVLVELDTGTGDVGAVWMQGVIRDATFGGSTQEIEVQVTSSVAPVESAEVGPWRITNRSREGVSFCNTTQASSGRSQDITAPPLIRVASGDYSLWTANERWQCKWHEEENRTGHNEMRVGGRNFSNGNDITASGLWANSENPVRDRLGLGEKNYVARVEVCVEGLIGTENCREYPNAGQPVLKPIGLLQEFGTEITSRLRFGLMTGSYTNNLSGGVLRKNIGDFSDEINPETGQFVVPPSNESIVRSIDVLRLYGYNHGSGLYNNAGDNCDVGVRLSDMQDGRCMNWGNPQAEILAESLRYLAGLDANSAFTHSGDDRITGLRSASWQDPLTPAEWCTPLNVIQFNASVNSFDDGAASAAQGLPGLGTLSAWTDAVGAGEAVGSQDVFSGGANRLCTAESITALSSFRGICPEAPNQRGTYDIAGLAHYAWTNDLRPDFDQGDQNVKLFGVSLAPAVPRIEIPRPGQSDAAVVILPACENQGDGGLRCALADFRIIEQDIAEGTGSFFIQWDVHEWGSDFDMDINGTLSYKIEGDQITVTTDAWSQSSSRSTGFGYIISGTTQDGFHAHSGINSYSRTNPVTGGPNCSNCRVTDPPSSHDFTLGGGLARLLREPLFYAAKWGGYDKGLNFPSNPQSWDTDGDGVPDNYFFAIDPSELLNALRAAFQSVLDQVEAVTVTTSTSRLDAGAVIFEAGLNPEDWTGDVTAIDPLTDETLWVASGKTSWQNRNVWMAESLSANDFSAVQDRLMEGIEELKNDPGCSGVFENSWYCGIDGTDLVDYVRGDPSETLDAGGALRSRSSFIGTVVNSDTVLSLRQDFVNEGWGRIDPEYFDFVDDKIERLGDPDDPGDPSKAAVLVGSNAGMLHAFSVESGEELFSYIPSMVLDRLYRQANPDFAPEPTVDGRFAIADAKIGNDWRTVLVGGLGGGGRGLYALDVTEPENFGRSNILWELTPDDLGAANIGHVFSAPVITRLADERFVAIFGNGVNGDDEVPELFVVDLEDGSIIDSERPTVADDARTGSSGLMGVALALAPSTRSHVDRVYAGDLAGRLWRFRMNAGGIESADLFFEAPEDQPITAPPTVAVSVQAGWDVFFGTGQFFADGDNIIAPDPEEPVQSFYLVRDTNQSDVRTRSNLGMARVSETVPAAGSRSERRSVEPVSFEREGWYLDLIDEDNRAAGERIVRRANVGFGAVLVNSYEPIDDICQGGGRVRLYVLDTITGQGLLQAGDDSCGDDCASVELTGSSAPISPPILIQSVQLDDIDGEPGEPGEPSDPTDLPILPDPDGLDRATWCSRFGVRTPEGFQTLGTVCDGRQTWRQIF